MTPLDISNDLSRQQADLLAAAARKGQIPFKTWEAKRRRRHDRTYKLIPLKSGGWKVRPGIGFGWFYILWAPGVLVLAGDAGDLRLEHHSAMADIIATLNWLRSTDVNYLLSKSSAKRELNRRATARDIVFMMKGNPGLRRLVREKIDDNPTITNIETHLRDLAPDQVALFCRDDLNLDDFYGTDTHTSTSIRLLGLIKVWRRLMEQHLRREEALP